MNDCAQLQRKEISDLRRLYSNQFRDSRPKTVWKVTFHNPEFIIDLHPFNERKSQNVNIEIHVRFTTKYPQTFPQVSVLTSNGLNERHLKEIDDIIQEEMKKHAGRPMIKPLCDSIQGYITLNNTFTSETDHKDSEKRMSSLHHEMIERKQLLTEIESIKQMEAKKLDEERKKLLQESHENELLGHIEKEIQRKAEKLKELKQKKKFRAKELQSENLDEFSELIEFEFSDEYQGSQFITVGIKELLSSDGDSSLYASKILGSESNDECFIHEHLLDKLENTHPLEELEKMLDRLQLLRHPNIQTIYSHKLLPHEDHHRIVILKSQTGKISLKDVVSLSGCISLQNTRIILKQILSLLIYLHSHNVYFKEIKLDQITFQHSLNDHLLLDNSIYKSLINPSSKSSPPLKQFSGVYPSFKHFPKLLDIYCLGLITIQMIFGFNTSPEVFESQPGKSSKRDLLQRKNWPMILF